MSNFDLKIETKLRLNQLEDQLIFLKTKIKQVIKTNIY